MTRYILFFVFLVSAYVSLAQNDKRLRPSPPAEASGVIDGVTIKIEYSTPGAKGRKMLGGLLPYGTIWRTGANESTSIELSGDTRIEGKELQAGSYALFTIPDKDKWVIIINRRVEWGAFTYKQNEDVLRVEVLATNTSSFVEKFNISIEGDRVVLRWENTEVAFRVTAKK